MNGGRFPGFEPAAQSPYWDPVTAGMVLARLDSPQALRFFTAAEAAAATALCDQLTGQDGDGPRIPVVAMIDSRLARAQTDGWRYADMPEDGQAWRDALGYLDQDASDRHGCCFAACAPAEQKAVMQAVQDAKDWHGLRTAHVWSLWTRYACTAFYSHPDAWNEIGFPGAGGSVLTQRLARRGWRVLALDAGPFWDPDADWVSDEAGSHHLYWTDPRVIDGTDPVPTGSNNSGRGVGGSMVHYAGYTPRFHPSDFATYSRDGVGADWPIGYDELAPYYRDLEAELPVAGEHWPWGGDHQRPVR